MDVWADSGECPTMFLMIILIALMFRAFIVHPEANLNSPSPIRLSVIDTPALSLCFLQLSLRTLDNALQDSQVPYV